MVRIDRLTMPVATLAWEKLATPVSLPRGSLGPNVGVTTHHEENGQPILVDRFK